jgi:pyruvate dehydrogenase E1 component alpha subunit/2-oxoisovalerate dehydrogenase E1 component alpha subunit
MSKERLGLWRWMVLARALDERLAALYRQGGIRGGSVFLGKGQEALSAAAAMPLRPGPDGDLYAPLIRDTAGRLVLGESMADVFLTHLGRRCGPMRGRDGNIHRGRPRMGMMPMISHLGSGVAPLCGGLMARRLQGRLGDTVALANLGDGAMNTGATHEGLNIAAVERLPLVLVVADNQVAYSTFSDRTYACRSLADRAAGYGFAAHTCDGTDADACLTTCATAVAAARSGAGPQMIVATLLRISGHGEHDDGSYVPQALRDRFPDPVSRFESTLLAEGLLDPATVQAAREDDRVRINAALNAAQAEAEPDPAEEDWCAFSVRNLRGEDGP